MFRCQSTNLFLENSPLSLFFLQTSHYSPLAQIDDEFPNRSLRRQAARLPVAVEDCAANVGLTGKSGRRTLDVSQVDRDTRIGEVPSPDQMHHYHV